MYCQVPDLKRGTAPEIDLALLETELRRDARPISCRRFHATRRTGDIRRLNDIALSGNGEPTSARVFPEVMELIGQGNGGFRPVEKIKLVLITNGSLAGRPSGAGGAAKHGQVATAKSGSSSTGRPPSACVGSINETGYREQHFQRLTVAATLCPTWLQTCVFAMDGEPPSEAEQQAYLATVSRIHAQKIPVQGVLLYGLARPSMQAQASRLSALPIEWLDAFAEKIRAAGLPVKVTL